MQRYCESLIDEKTNDPVERERFEKLDERMFPLVTPFSLFVLKADQNVKTPIELAFIVAHENSRAESIQLLQLLLSGPLFNTSVDTGFTCGPALPI